MAYRQINYNNPMGRNPLGPIFSILLFVLFFVALFFLARVVFEILSYAAPVMLIAALIIDYKVVTGYLQWIGGLFRRNVLYGIGATLLSILGFPVVSAFLLGKALFKRKVKQVRNDMEERRQGEFVEYEELESDIPEVLELPEMATRSTKPPREQPRRNEYDQLFD